MIPVGLVGTSWWSDIMYLPTLQNHPDGQIVAICGRDSVRLQEVAAKWNIPHVYTDYNAMIDSGHIQAILVITPNVSHYDITMKALQAGLHVLCEKPLAMTYDRARQMAELADQKGVRHFVPFTWIFMPGTRYIKQLIDEGYIGTPYDFTMRWYGGGALNSNYQWRFDAGQAGSGALGDLGSHLLYIAYSYFGRMTQVSSQLGYFSPRAQTDADGKPYQPADDFASLLVKFESGVLGTFHISYVAYEEAPGTTQQIEIHGSEGALYYRFDFANTQQVLGARGDDKTLHELTIPDSILAGASLENSVATMTDVFMKQDFMARAWLSSIAHDKPLKPDFHDGAHIQRVIDAALKSHHERRWVDVASIT
jgi:predicted dehydrogenase